MRVKENNFFYVVCLVFIFFSSCGKKDEAKIQQPNVLLLCVDDLRPELACYGNKQIISPNIDKLASEGCLFKHHYVQCAICGPSRSTLMTGKIEQGWDIWEGCREKGVEPKQAVSLPHLFKRNGYTTVGIGKITHQPGGVLDEKQTQHVIPFSWDTTYTAVGKWKTPWRAFFAYANGDAHNTAMRIGVDTPHLPFEKGDVEDEGYPDGLNALEAVNQLKHLKDENKPFFLAVGFFKPHLPCNAPKKYWDLYDPAKISLADNNYPPKDANTEYCVNKSPELTTHYPWPDGAGIVSTESARNQKHAYYACVSYIDAQVGKILDELNQQGLEENTIVVLWSDHGWHLGEHGIWGKMTNFNTATNSPLIIKTPGHISNAQITDAIVETVDIYPTLAELCGLKHRNDLDGKSLVPLLKNNEAKSNSYARSFYYRNGALGKTIKTENHRIVKWATETDSIVAIELYDHSNDPQENVNIAHSHTELKDSLLILLESANFLSNDKPFVTGWE